MPYIRTRLTFLYGQKTTVDDGEVKFDAEGVAEVTQAQYDALVVGPHYCDPDDPGESPVNPEAAVAAAVPTPGGDPEEFVLAYIRYTADPERLRRVYNAVSERLEVYVDDTVGKCSPPPEFSTALPEPQPTDANGDPILPPSHPDYVDPQDDQSEPPTPPEPVGTVPAEPGEAPAPPDAVEIPSKAAEIIGLVKQIADVADLDVFEQAEKDGQNRSTVLRAIAERRAELTPPV